MRRGLRCWLWRTLRRRLRVRICVGVWLWRFDGREKITPKNQYRRRGYQSQNKSLLLLHSNFLLPLPLGEGWGEGLYALLVPPPSPNGRGGNPSDQSFFSLHRIISAGMKRMTAQETPDRHSASAQHAVPFNRLTRIFGTRGNKPARRRQPGRDRGFVKLQKRNKNDAHR